MSAGSQLGVFCPSPRKGVFQGSGVPHLNPSKGRFSQIHIYGQNQKNTLYGIKNDDFASETLCRKEDVAVLRLKKFRIYPGAPMADNVYRIDSIEKALILRNQAV